jgi:hypothetical protein
MYSLRWWANKWVNEGNGSNTKIVNSGEYNTPDPHSGIEALTSNLLRDGFTYIELKFYKVEEE